MKRLFVVMTLLLVACHKHPVQDLPGTLQGFPMGTNAETMANMLEKAGFKKVLKIDWITNNMIENGATDQEISNFLKNYDYSKEIGFDDKYDYIFKGKYMGIDNAVIQFGTKNNAVCSIWIFQIKPDISSLRKLYTKIHGILIEKYSDFHDFFKYEVNTKDELGIELTSDQVLKYIDGKNNVFCSISIPIQGDTYGYSSPMVQLKIVNGSVYLEYANPLISRVLN